MEDLFDFQIDYESLITTPAIHQIAEPEEDDLYEEVIQGSKKSFRCTFSGCGKIFKFKSEITRHVIIHQNDRPYVCNHTGCNKSFKRADALENHVRIHEGVLPHKCEFPNCDRKFATKAALRYHQIRHSNNKVFKCDIEGCNKTFLTSSQLKQHQKAFNSHQKCPLLKIEEPEPVKMVHCNPDLQSWELADQVTKCGESIQWEMKTQENGEMEKFEHLVKYIINENRILKQKLQECEKQKDYPAKNACNASFNSQPLCFESNESSSYFDSYELKFLEFLKGHEDSSF